MDLHKLEDYADTQYAYIKPTWASDSLTTSKNLRLGLVIEASNMVLIGTDALKTVLDVGPKQSQKLLNLVTVWRSIRPSLPLEGQHHFWAYPLRIQSYFSLLLPKDRLLVAQQCAHDDLSSQETEKAIDGALLLSLETGELSNKIKTIQSKMDTIAGQIIHDKTNEVLTDKYHAELDRLNTLQTLHTNLLTKYAPAQATV